MAQAQVRKPQAQEVFTTKDLLDMINIIADPSKSTLMNPAKVNSPRISAKISLEIWEIMQIVSEDKRGTVYDSALKKLGNGDKNDALTTLASSLRTALERCESLKPKKEADYGEFSTQFHAMLVNIGKGIAEDQKEIYTYLRPAVNPVTSLIRTFEGGEVKSEVRKQDTVASAEALPIIVPPIQDLGPIILVDNTKDESVVTINGAPPSVLVALFGNEAQAQSAVNAIAGAYATMANHPDDLTSQRDAAQKLYEALNNIPSGREIWQRPGFQSAMRSLQNGDLQGGLRELAGESAFNSALSSLNNLYVISVSSRAVSVMRAGLTIRYEFEKNLQAFEEFRRLAAKDKFEPRVIWMALGLEYSYYIMSGQLSQIQMVAGPNGEQSLQKVGGKKIDGYGHRLGVTPQLAVGTSFWGQPTEIVLHVTTGYDTNEVVANIQSDDGSSQSLRVGSEGMFLGVTGIETRFRGKEGNINVIRMENIGLGNVGTKFNPLAYVTFSGNWAETNTLRIQTLLTPQYSYFLEQHRAGGLLRPIDLTFQTHKDWTLYGGPGFRYEYNVDNQVNTYDVHGSVGVRYQRKVAIDLQAGYVTEAGGDESQRIPSTPFGTVNVTLNLPELFMRERSTLKSTPKKVETKVEGPKVEASARVKTKKKGGKK